MKCFLFFSFFRFFIFTNLKNSNSIVLFPHLQFFGTFFKSFCVYTIEFSLANEHPLVMDWSRFYLPFLPKSAAKLKTWRWHLTNVNHFIRLVCLNFNSFYSSRILKFSFILPFNIWVKSATADFVILIFKRNWNFCVSLSFNSRALPFHYLPTKDVRIGHRKWSFELMFKKLISLIEFRFFLFHFLCWRRYFLIRNE